MFQPKSNYFGLFSVPLKGIHCPFLSLTECHGSKREKGGDIHGRGYREERERETGCNFILIKKLMKQTFYFIFRKPLASINPL